MSTRVEKVVERGSLGDPGGRDDDLRYWLAQSPEARLSCVEILRRQSYGDTPRLQRTVEVIRGFPG